MYVLCLRVTLQSKTFRWVQFEDLDEKIDS